jgi:DNA polymerase-3 subunit epsilon
MWRSLHRWQARRRHGHGPWAALLAPPPDDEWVSLDLETSGLDPACDSILTIAAVPVTAGRIRLADRFEAVLHPPPGLDIASIRHHRLRPQDLAGGLDEQEAVARLLHWLGPRTLIGYRIGFDVAMLDRVVPGITGFALPNPRIDLARRFRTRMHRRSPHATAGDSGFEAIAEALGVPMLGRHTALGDATTAAACWLAMRAG